MKLKRLFATLLLVVPLVFSISSHPPDHLVPPPPATHNRLPPAPKFRIAQPEPPGFMQRIARWFGFGDSGKEQQILQESYQHPQYKEAPHNNYQYNRQKAPCNPCNKIPWIPMFPGNLQYPILKGQADQPHFPQIKYNHHPNNFQHVNLPTYSPEPQNHHHHQQQPQNPSSFNPNFNNYQSNSHFLQNQDYRQGDRRPHQLIPIPVPNLSATPIPPIYDSVPFNDLPRVNRHQQQFFEPATQLSQIQEVLPTQIIPSQKTPINPESSSSFEIVQSIPLTDYVTSVEYPVNVQSSQVIDVSKQQSQQNSNYLHDDVPKLIELGSYEQNILPYSQHQYQEFISEPIVVQHHNVEPDNFPAASSHNISYRHENNLDIQNFNNVPPPPSSSNDDIIIATEPSTSKPEVSTEIRQTHVEFQPSLQTISEKPGILKRDRETPKKFLDSPIFYTHGSSPRPFTKDSSDLRVRSSTYEHNPWQSSPTPTPWIFSPPPTSTYSSLSLDASGQWAGISPPSQFQPNPHPFVLPTEKRPKQIHQIIIPYTSNNHPQPFSVREEQNDQPTDEGRYANWSHSHEIDLHEQQESKLVTATEQPVKKTTKYLTKILASNIRELLKKEHEIKNKTNKLSFDFSKLQKNIDDWTEQEFSSSAHKSSTISIRGRSKNIPNEYLTTTPSLTQLKSSTVTTENPNTTNFDSLLDEEAQKYEDYFAKLLESNRIETSENAQSENILTRTTIPTITTTISTTSQPPISPFYVRSVPPTRSMHELWNNLKVSISPITNEKVYVVTPQPQLQQQQTSSDSVGTFKSPRFLIRPTPGANQIPSSTLKSDRKHTPELFGLLGIAEYNPPTPIETIDGGHSKVITIITPSSNKKRSPDNKDEDNSNKLPFNPTESLSDATS